MSCASTDFPVLSRLLAANVTWSKAVLAEDPNFFTNSAKSQAPKVLWIGCADSRVPESVIMAANPGEIFVHRNIANQFDPCDNNGLSVLAYAVEHLHVEHVVVAGHTHCGGAKAAFESAKARASPPCARPAPLDQWLAPLTALVRTLNLGPMDAEHAVPIIVNASVKAQVDKIVKTDTIRNAWAARKSVHVHGWVYQVEKGTLKDLEISRGPPCK